MSLLQTVYLAAEDAPGLAIGRRLIASSPPLTVSREENGRGFGKLKNSAPNYNRMAGFGYPVLLIVDVDSAECPEDLRSSWLTPKPHESFLFRVAIREIESWILADHEAMADFLRIKRSILPDNPEQLVDPKATLLRLAQAAPRKIRDGLLPERGSKAIIGPEYNYLLADHIYNRWDLSKASARSTSLRRAMAAVAKLANRV
jgi:hypothetical protein